MLFGERDTDRLKRRANAHLALTDAPLGQADDVHTWKARADARLDDHRMGLDANQTTCMKQTHGAWTYTARAERKGRQTPGKGALPQRPRRRPPVSATGLSSVGAGLGWCSNP